MTYRIVFAGTPQFATASLQRLLESSHSVVAVYTQPDRPAGRGREVMGSPVKQMAIAHQIPVFQPEHLRDENEFRRLSDLKPDILVVVVYGMLVPSTILALPRFGCVNVHPSLLPRWRGASPIQSAILAGDRETGVTIMQMEAKMDTGPILATWKCKILPDDNARVLQEKLAKHGADLLLQTINQIEKAISSGIKQDDTQATHTSKIEKKDALIDWALSADEIHRKIRAFNPVPVAFTHFNGERLRIWEAALLEEKHAEKPGTLIRLEKKGLVVAAGENALRLLRVQLPGGRAQSAEDFINAHKKGLIVKSVIVA